jgi:hypothetical protein
MTQRWSPDHILRLRLQSQRLTPAERGTSVAEVVRACVGMQAQEPPAAALAVRARSAGLLASDVARARVADRSVVRTWALRGTLHLVATDDLGWLLALLGPPFIQGDERRRRELGLDEATCTRGIRLLRSVLAHGPLTRAAISEQLASHGLVIVGQAAPHLLARAALEGVICFGPDRDKEPTYVLLDDWVEVRRALADETALTELARRYLAGYGPARPEDWAAWSGLPLPAGRAAWQRIAEDLVEVATERGAAWVLRTQWVGPDEAAPAGPLVRLLGGYDAYLLGYRGRDAVLDPAHARRLHPGGGVIRPALLVDGRVAGTWRLVRQRARLEVSVAPFAGLAPGVLEALEAEAADVARFLALPGTLKVEG